MFQGLRTLILHVHELQAAKAWYTAALGIQPYYDTPYYGGYDVAGYELGLHPMAKDEKPQGSRAVAYWGVADVAAAVAHLVQHGATVSEAPKDVGGGIVVGAVTDPFGNQFAVIYNPQFTGQAQTPPA